MSWTVTIGPTAEREIHKLDPRAQKRVLAALDKLAADPRPLGVVMLSGYWQFWRLRVGEYRIIYRIEQEAGRVLVLLVRHRKDAYRDLHILEDRLLTALGRAGNNRS